MTRACIFVLCPRGVHAPEENYARTRELFARFSGIHPLFARISPRATRSGRAIMAAQPAFPEITSDEWKAAYLAHHKVAHRYGNIPHLGVGIPYWNRAERPCFQMIELNYDVTSEFWDNEVMLTDLASDLVRSDIVLALMRACIEVFDADRAECAWLTEGENIDFLYHRLWLKAGVPFPEGESRPVPGERIRARPINRYPLGHAPPLEAESWLDGTLYTWPEHDPEQLMRQTVAQN